MPKRVIYVLCAMAFWTSHAQAVPLLQNSTIAKYAYLIDQTSNTVLIDKEAEAKMYPASMTKIMTAYMAFRQLKDDLIRLDDQVLVSRKANRMGGSKMFIEEGKTVALEDILRGIIVQSGNDASVALAEFIAGDEASFAELMNATAASIGMTGTNFVNASGWPDENHYTTAKDLAILSDRMIKDFPNLYEIFSEKSFTFSDITQNNRNKLLGKSGVDGIKTGHTEASGYGMVSSGVQDGRRLILVLNGLKNSAKRASESLRLLNLAFRSTASKVFYTEQDIITALPVWYGKKTDLNVRASRPVSLTEKATLLKEVTRTVTYEKPLRAPIKAGQKIGQIHLHTKDKIILSVDILAAESIAEQSYLERFSSNINYLLWGARP